MKNLGLWAFFLFAILIAGCAGGGGGGSSTSGGSTGGLGSNAEVAGQVVIDGTATGIEGVRVLLFDGAGILVAQGTTNSLGSYRIQVTPAAKTYFLDSSTVNRSIFYGSFYVGSLSYQLSMPTCKPNLPALSAGATFAAGRMDIPLRTDPPPPPPNGCN